MTRRAFTRFMLDVEIGHNLKLIGLTDSEWRAHIAGVLPIAAKSPIRGRLLIGDLPAGPEHVAHQAGVKVAAARRALTKLREVGVLMRDEEFGCERVHDWDEWNPAPKTDNTAAERQQRRRDRIRDEAVVTPASRRDDRDITPTKEKEKLKVEEQPLGPAGMSHLSVVEGEAS